MTATLIICTFEGVIDWICGIICIFKEVTDYDNRFGYTHRLEKKLYLSMFKLDYNKNAT